MWLDKEARDMGMESRPHLFDMAPLELHSKSRTVLIHFYCSWITSFLNYIYAYVH